MELIRVTVYRLYPTPEQAAQMARIAGGCRYVYNLALEQRRGWWRSGRRFSFAQQCRELTALRREVDWLRGCPVHALQNALRDVDRAYQNWWVSRAAAPRFRRQPQRQLPRERSGLLRVAPHWAQDRDGPHPQGWLGTPARLDCDPRRDA